MRQAWFEFTCSRVHGVRPRERAGLLWDSQAAATYRRQTCEPRIVSYLELASVSMLAKVFHAPPQNKARSWCTEAPQKMRMTVGRNSASPGQRLKWRSQCLLKSSKSATFPEITDTLPRAPFGHWRQNTPDVTPFVRMTYNVWPPILKSWWFVFYLFIKWGICKGLPKYNYLQQILIKHLAFTVQGVRWAFYFLSKWMKITSHFVCLFALLRFNEENKLAYHTFHI